MNIEDLIPSGMTDVAMLSIVFGFFSPIILNFIIAQSWSKPVKALVSFGFAVVVGALTALVSGAYAGLGIPSAILLTFVASITAYKNFWEQVGLTNRTGKEDV